MSGVCHTCMHPRLLSSTSSWIPWLAPCFTNSKSVQCLPKSPRLVLVGGKAFLWGNASLHRSDWLSWLFHCSCGSEIQATAGEVSRATLVSRKLLLDGSYFRAAVCPWSKFQVSLTCFLCSAFVVTFLWMSRRGYVRGGIKAEHGCGFDASSHSCINRVVF